MVVAERRQHVFEEVQKRVDRYKSVPAGSGRVVVPVLIDRVAQFADEERPVLARPALMFGLVAERERLKRSEGRRVGKACVSKWRSRWSPDHQKKNTDNTHFVTAY